MAIGMSFLYAEIKDIQGACGSHVRFTPESGHVRCSYRCPLWAKSGHQCTQPFVAMLRRFSARCA